MELENLEHYDYLPSKDGSVTIKESKIHGLGIFATRKITKGNTIGVSHVSIGCHCYRVNFGGYINHSDEPNSEIVKAGILEYTTKAILDIEKGQEITVDYRKSICGCKPNV